MVDYDGLKKILNHIPCGLLFAGEDGEILFNNDKAAAYLETDSIDFMERGLAAVPDWSGLAEAVRTLGNEEHQRQKVEFSRGSRHFSVSVARGGLVLFEKACLAIVIEDVTRPKELENLKTGFFNEFLRRIKGPLTSVKIALSVLSSDRYASLDSDAREVAQLGFEEIKRLHSHLSDMSDLYALESHCAATDLYMENVEVAAVLNRALREARKLSKGRNREITIECSEADRPMRVVADYDKLSLVLNHLVDNALTYSPIDAPIRLAANKVEGGMEIRVEDQGIGIARKDLPLVFDKFFRSMDPTVAESEGQGLGLFLAKGFTELMGGTLSMSSEVDVGTKAVVFLPAPAEDGWLQ